MDVSHKGQGYIKGDKDEDIVEDSSGSDSGFWTALSQVICSFK